jgi:peptidoglycan/LPS O-acetylase OafA/YrhL
VVKQRERLAPIAGLRGLAAMMVLVHHVYLAANGTFGNGFDVELTFVRSGVDLFFVLSGFCLFYPYAAGGSVQSWKRFFSRRAVRILPPYYAMILTLSIVPIAVAPALRWMGLLVATASAPTTRQVISHFLMAHTLAPDTFYGIDGPFWSLGVETQFYIACPLAFWLVSRWHWRGAAVIAAIAIVYRAGVLVYATSGAAGSLRSEANGSLVVLVNLFPGRWLEFGMGMFVATLIKKRRVAMLTSAREMLLLTMATILYLLTQIYLLESAGNWLLPWADCTFGLCFSVLVLLACADGTAMGKFFSSSVPALVGAISYSLYLVHYPIVMALGGALTSSRLTSAERMLAIGVFGIPLSLAAAACFYQLFERPFLSGWPVRRGSEPVLVGATMAP